MRTLVIESRARGIVHEGFRRGAVRENNFVGGGLDAAVARHGGSRADWLDLSTGINPDSLPNRPPDGRNMVRLARRLPRCEARGGNAKLLGRPGGGGNRRRARRLESMRCLFRADQCSQSLR